MRIFDALERVPKQIMLGIGVVLIGVLAVIDHITDVGAVLSFLYVIPVFLVTWYVGLLAGSVASLLAAAAWFGNNFAIYPATLTTNDVRDVLVGVLFFQISAYILSTLKKSLDFQKRVATTDYLTGISNVRWFTIRTEQEIYRADRYGRVFSVAYLDIDDFKLVNDKFGHSAGNQLLMVVARAIDRHIRLTDVVCAVGRRRVRHAVCRDGRDGREGRDREDPDTAKGGDGRKRLAGHFQHRSCDVR